MSIFLIRRTNILVLVIFSILFILIVNASEEGTNETYNQSDELTLELKENLENRL